MYGHEGVMILVSDSIFMHMSFPFVQGYSFWDPDKGQNGNQETKCVERVRDIKYKCVTGGGGPMKSLWGGCVYQDWLTSSFLCLIR